MKTVITIDGPSERRQRHDSDYLPENWDINILIQAPCTGHVAWKVIKAKIKLDDEGTLKKLLDETDIAFNGDMITVDGTDVASEIRTAEIGELSSHVSAIPVVRQSLFSIQRTMCLEGKVVIEGRDTGTTIFPEAENKFFLDASIEERARRRYDELKTNDSRVTIEATIEDIKKRDSRDSTRKNSPLTKTDDMLYIDSTNLSINEVVEMIIEFKK
jgi:cytidylate kinase